MAGGLCLALRKTGFLSAQPQMPSPGPPSPPRSGRSQAGGGSVGCDFLQQHPEAALGVHRLESRATEQDRAAPLSVTGSPAEEVNHHHFHYIASESLEQRSPFVSRPHGPDPFTTLCGFSPVMRMPPSGEVAVIPLSYRRELRLGRKSSVIRTHARWSGTCLESRARLVWLYKLHPDRPL